MVFCSSSTLQNNQKSTQSFVSIFHRRPFFPHCLQKERKGLSLKDGAIIPKTGELIPEGKFFFHNASISYILWSGLAIWNSVYGCAQSETLRNHKQVSYRYWLARYAHSGAGGRTLSRVLQGWKTIQANVIPEWDVLQLQRDEWVEDRVFQSNRVEEKLILWMVSVYTFIFSFSLHLLSTYRYYLWYRYKDD